MPIDPAVLLLLLAIAVIALELLTGTMVMLGAGIALIALSGLTALTPLGPAASSILAAILWGGATLALRHFFRTSKGPADPNEYSREPSDSSADTGAR